MARPYGSIQRASPSRLRKGGLKVPRRYLYIALGVLALVAAIAIPGFAQPGWGGFGACHGGFVQGSPPAGPMTIDTAVSRVREVLAASGYTDLVPEEIMEFSNHYYVVVVEKSTGIGAMELIVERNGFVHLEPGPNMMWNTKYGHMAGAGWRPGMMGGWGSRGWTGPGAAPPTQTVDKGRARQIAAQYLAAAFPGATPDKGTAFHGYYTFDAERSGKTFGMLSVNGYTGQVWYHTWHGTFIREKHF